MGTGVIFCAFRSLVFAPSVTHQTVYRIHITCVCTLRWHPLFFGGVGGREGGGQTQPEYKSTDEEGATTWNNQILSDYTFQETFFRKRFFG